MIVGGLPNYSFIIEVKIERRASTHPLGTGPLSLRFSNEDIYKVWNDE